MSDILEDSDSDVSFLDELDDDEMDRLVKDGAGHQEGHVEALPAAPKREPPTVISRTMVEMLIIVAIGSLLLQVAFVTWQHDQAKMTIRRLNEKLTSLQTERNELFDELQEVAKEQLHAESKAGRGDDSLFSASGFEENALIRRFTSYPWTMISIAIYTVGVFVLCVRSSYKEENRRLSDKYEELLKKAEQKRTQMRDELIKLRADHSSVKLQNRQFIEEINRLHEQLFAQMPRELLDDDNDEF